MCDKENDILFTFPDISIIKRFQVVSSFLTAAVF